jgi:hypothetical protein
MSVDKRPLPLPYEGLPDELRPLAMEVDVALHVLWTRAVDDHNYDKADWRRLANAIDALIGDVHRVRQR